MVSGAALLTLAPLKPGNEREAREKLEKLVDAQQLQVEEHQHLRLKLEALVRLERDKVKELEQQLAGTQELAQGPQDTVRLQMVLQGRDKQLDDLSKEYTEKLKEAENNAFEATLAKQEVSTLRAEVSDSREELERSIRCEAQLRAQIFELRDQNQKLQESLGEEQARSSQVAQATAAMQAAEERSRALEKQMAEEKQEAKQEIDTFKVQTDESMSIKDQTIRHQTSAIEALTRELKERKVEIERLTDILASGDSEGNMPAKGVTRVFLPPLGPKPMEDVEVKKSIENLRKQLKAKESKLSKQTERLQGLGDLLEERDTQLQELSSARRDREKLRVRLADLEDAMKVQKKVLSRADAERRLIGQEARLKESERQIKELGESLHKERTERQVASCELRALEERLSRGADCAVSMDDANEAMTQELAEHRVQLAVQREQVDKLEATLAAAQADVRKLSERTRPEAEDVATLPQVQRKLRKLESVDQQLARDVLMHLQDRENRIEILNSTVALLRQTVEDLQPEKAETEALS
ncbi:unnamed protein product [Effrenium voratum]|nr:unnamed protein product [Effrenium voratum]